METKKVGSKTICQDCGEVYHTSEGHKCKVEIKERDYWLPDSPQSDRED